MNELAGDAFQLARMQPIFRQQYGSCDRRKRLEGEQGLRLSGGIACGEAVELAICGDHCQVRAGEVLPRSLDLEHVGCLLGNLCLDIATPPVHTQNGVGEDEAGGLAGAQLQQGQCSRLGIGLKL
ncbi:hypothetical protein PKOR_15785 [Pontibacter korlensis]|uniref:Uncharacterized protein n=1 Tax=Pontibacter korlensis TaxID=400092 RepID=A0A0E3ZHX5_9BACT|nr:hypothetical protein PKOR_15785 [Pontibacter korlensis]